MKQQQHDTVISLNSNLISKKLDWDTEFWGFGVLDLRGEIDITKHQLELLSSSNNAKFIQYTCGAHEVDYARHAEKIGFLHGDIRVTLQKELLKNVQNNDRRAIHLATKCDIQTLQSFASSLYIDSRYSNDRNFRYERVCDFYREWISNAVMGTFDDMCFCVVEDLTPVGFCTIKHTSYDTAKIGLVGVNPDFQGRGLAVKMLNGVCAAVYEQGCRLLSVATQGRNTAAQRLYQRVGFTTSSIELIYHYWRTQNA